MKKQEANRAAMDTSMLGSRDCVAVRVFASHHCCRYSICGAGVI